MAMASLRTFESQTFNNNWQRGMTNNDMYLTIWQVWSLVFKPTWQTLIMVKKILNFPDHWGKRAKVIGAVLLKDTTRMGSSKGVSHHKAFLHLKPDFIGIHTDKVLILHIGSRADPCHSHDKLKNSQEKHRKQEPWIHKSSSNCQEILFTCQPKAMLPMPT